MHIRAADLFILVVSGAVIGWKMSGGDANVTLTKDPRISVTDEEAEGIERAEGVAIFRFLQLR